MGDALEGLRVVDISESVGGQYCGRLFADFGAATVLVEPAGGSVVRRMSPYSANSDARSLLFWHLNTGKTSIELAAEVEAALARLKPLLAHADVVIHPIDMDQSIKAAIPASAVTVAVSPFGDDGPLADWRGPEIVLQALSGMMHNNGQHRREPLYGTGHRASFAAGLAAYVGATAALYARSRPGKAQGQGQAVLVDSAETAAAMCFPYVLQHIYNGTVKSRGDQNIPAGQVRCRDGWVCIWIYNFRWKAACGALRLRQLIDDPRFAEPTARRQNWGQLFDIIAAQVADWDAEMLVADLQAAEVIAAKAYLPSELATNRHLAERGYWEEVDGRRILGPPFRLGKTPRRVLRGAPNIVGAGDPPARPEPDTTARPSPARTVPGGALEGIRVIELTTAWAGPMAGRVLSFLGAESVHVESPNRVNSWRLNKETPNPINFPDLQPGERPFDRAFLFNSQNVNKRSCILNLKHEAARQILRKMVGKADVLICNFRPGTLAKLGCDYDTLRRIKPDIIVAELPAFGIAGPMSSYAALGPTMEMATGMARMIGYADGKPETTGPSYLDPIGGFNAAAAILTALLYRQRTGEGQHIEVAQVEAAMQFIGADLLAAAETGIDPAPNGNRSPEAAPHDAFRALGDDQWVAIAAQDEAQWQTLCETIGQVELAEDPRFATLQARKVNEDELTAILTRFTSTHDKRDIANALQAAGVAAAPVQTPADVAQSAYLAHRGFFTELDHADAGRHRHPGLPIHLSLTPGSQRKAAPAFGADNDHVLFEMLDLSSDEVAALKQSDAMGSAPFPGC